MGWRELRGYVREMNRAQEAQRAQPGSWRGAEQDPHWQEMRAKRERFYGRG